MEVNYYKLVDDHYILKEEDTLILYGIKYRVRRSTGGYFLRNSSTGDNAAVFKLFGMRYPETDEWAKQFGEVTEGGCFPEFRKLEDLTKCVIALYEKPLYKKGDKVRIAERKGDASDYPLVFVDAMTRLEGEVFEIESSHPMCRSSYTRAEEAARGDVHLYVLKGVFHNWHSSMFTKVNEEQSYSKPIDNSVNEKSEITINIKSVSKTIIKL